MIATKKISTKQEKTGLAPVTVTPEEHVEAVKNFMHTCLKVTFTKTGLPKSKQASDDTVERVAEEAGGEEAAFTVSKRLFSCDDVTIDKVNEWARQIDKLRAMYTFPMAAADSASAEVLAKEKSTRLIRIDDIDDFEAQLEELERKGAAVSKELADRYDLIMAKERKRFGNQFNASDYPTREGCWKEVVKADGTTEVIPILRIGKRSYPEVTASVRLPERVLERMTVQAAELMNQSVEVAVADLAKVLTETFATLSSQLTDRIRIRPRFGTPIYAEVGAEAEVLKIKRHADDPDVPEGRLVLLLSYAGEAAGAGRKRQTIKEEVGPLTEEEYQALRPEPMETTRKLTTSVVERFGTYLDTFTSLSKQLGAYGSRFDEALDSLRELHHAAATGSRKQGVEAVVDGIKHSPDLRRRLRRQLDDVSEHLLDVATEAKKVRRQLHAHIARQVAQAQKAERRT